jgi:hypothetical protein
MTYRLAIVALSPSLGRRMRPIADRWTSAGPFDTLDAIGAWLGAQRMNLASHLKHDETYFLVLAVDANGVTAGGWEVAKDYPHATTFYGRNKLRAMLGALQPKDRTVAR